MCPAHDADFDLKKNLKTADIASVNKELERSGLHNFCGVPRTAGGPGGTSSWTFRFNPTLATPPFPPGSPSRKGVRGAKGCNRRLWRLAVLRAALPITLVTDVSVVVLPLLLPLLLLLNERTLDLGASNPTIADAVRQLSFGCRWREAGIMMSIGS
jgi:hypothetical protein